MKRRFVPIWKVAEVAGYDELWMVEWENMGWCKDGVTRWYHFDDENGNPCYTLKR